MSRLVWFVLNDGSSVVAGCGSLTSDMLTSVLSEPERTLTLTSRDSIHVISSSTIREFVFFDSKNSLPPASAIYNYVRM